MFLPLKKNFLSIPPPQFVSPFLPCLLSDVLLSLAGGSASTGPFRDAIRSILDLVPRDIHDKCPVIIGCKRDVDMVLAYYK
jgi:Fructose-1-6-bisphosphatase, C-terminal domain